MATDPKPTVHVVAAEIVDDSGRYLIAQRNAHAVLPLLWEFPGGRVREGESEQQALSRCLAATLDVAVVCIEKSMNVRRDYGAYEVLLSVWSCAIASGDPRCKYVHDFRWVAPAELRHYSFPPADRETVNLLLGFTAEG